MNVFHRRLGLAARRGLIPLALILCAASVRADEVQLAVAANFAGPVEKIAAEFTRETGHMAVVSIGSTGKFYAQIKNGAPFEILLAADQATPQKLQDDGLVVEGRRFTYAIGKLVLYSATPGYVDVEGHVLGKGGFQHLALANPQTAPYGSAGRETLKSMGLWETLQPRIVQGDNIAQTFDFIVSGNAELGFVALSQVAAPGKAANGSWWLVPAGLYKAILQDAVLLKSGAGHAAALSFMDFLRSDKVRRLIQSYGYGT